MGMSRLGLQASAIGRREKQLSCQLLDISGRGKQVLSLNKITEGWEITAKWNSAIALCCLPYGASSIHACTLLSIVTKLWDSITMQWQGINLEVCCCSPAPLEKVFFMSVLQRDLIYNIQQKCFFWGGDGKSKVRIISNRSSLNYKGNLRRKQFKSMHQKRTFKCSWPFSKEWFSCIAE